MLQGWWQKVILHGLVEFQRLTNKRPVMQPDLARLGELGNTSVVGLQWGDEGKGKIVDLLTQRFDYVIRWNGGSNAGHSVKVGEKKYAFHLLPSGVLRPACVCMLANGVVIDPIQLLREMDDLMSCGIELGENFKISSAAHVVMPYHKLQDQLSEAQLGGKKIGTTARGIGPCYADKAGRGNAIRMADLVAEDRLREKLQRIMAEKNRLLLGLYAATPLEWEPIFEQYRSCGQQLKAYVCNSVHVLHEALAARKHLLFEGANAVLLDLDHGTFPYVTSSNCGSGLSAGTGVPGSAVKSVLGVVKAYSSRVGAGPFPTEQENAIGEKIRQRGNEFGTTTGRPRRCGWIDLVAVRYAARLAGATGLCITLLDVLSTFDCLKLCVGYKIGGREQVGFEPDAEGLACVEPVYEELPGWHEPLDHLADISALPPNARRYLDRIEEYVGVPVKLVSVGPDRGQTLLV